MRVPAGFTKQIMTFRLSAALSATTDPLVRFYAKEGMTPLACRITPLTTFDRGDSNETYVVSVEDDTVKISNDNAAVTNGNNALPIECTFTNKHIAEGSVVEIVATLGGTTPSVPLGSIVEFEYLAG